MMKPFVFLFLLVQGVSAVTHSLKYFYTASSGVKNFPEYVSVGMVDDAPMYYCDSISSRTELKQDWMNKVTAEDPQYEERNTQICVGLQQSFKANIGVVKQRLNQTGGVHLFQWMYGCEWDDETDEVKGYDQFGYDGEDFVSFNLKAEDWSAPKPEGVITKHKWDNDRAYIAQKYNYFTHICPEWLKKYVNYGRSSLMRKDLPSVSLLQKTPSSPVSCHATGFYPDRAMMFWRKDGEEIHEGVEQGEILPNHDGSFQMNVDLDISSVSPEDWRRYDCVFQLSGVKDDVITKLDTKDTRSNGVKRTDMTTIIIIVVTTCGVVAVILIVVVRVKLHKKKNAKPQPDMKIPPDAPAGGFENEDKKTPPEKSPIGRLMRTVSQSSDDSSVESGGSVRSDGSDTPLIQRNK